jgi:hypothetical protein
VSVGICAGKREQTPRKEDRFPAGKKAPALDEKALGFKKKDQGLGQNVLGLL